MWIRRPDDFHVHLRQGPELGAYAARSAEHFGRIMVMPNTVPPIRTSDQWIFYRDEIKRAAPGMEVLGTVKLFPGEEERVAFWKEAGIIAGKLYPRGSTTNSEDGANSIEELFPVFEEMERNRIVLSIHGEVPGSYVLDREKDFWPQIECISRTFPGLKIVVEHLSDGESVDRVMDLPDNVAATLTAHHLWLTLDDVIGGAMDPHHFCKPLIKGPLDREKLVEAALNSRGKIFFGSDTAPHSCDAKRVGAAGIYATPTALSILAQVFEERGALDRLEPFASEYGAAFYGLELNEGRIELVPESWTVPEIIDGVVPLGHGRTLKWRAVSKEKSD